MRIRIFTLPNLITCLNLLAGCMAIKSALQYEWTHAFWWIAAAAVFDFLDGFAARLTKSYSEVGKQLDSLADVVSFGAAPSFILYTLTDYAYDYSGSLKYVAFIVVVFSALRLAKFNVDTRQATGFIGLPTPANALLIAAMGYMAEKEPLAIDLFLFDCRWLPVATGAVLAFLLISELPMFGLKFTDYSFANNKLKYLFLLLSVVCIAAFGVTGVFLTIVLYIVLSVIARTVCRPQRASRNV